ncbi:hypothetical protein P2H44_21325 [Albimonas sp. CAU 1670]|uniref:hypothetical protein n=1 Tax=Albimonas sp. CAU 1670 TaxID=3032599 RepID=UPI0023DCA6B6|nr:hypothetical protein [Albimonas sp. CAU 1670]MDF2235107.1 hypothetical protein [Albimonas sp. CAU 1670]
MTKPTPRGYRFAKVTKIYLVNESQAKTAVTIARLLARDTVSSCGEIDNDGNAFEYTVMGDDYQNLDGTPDIAGAIADLPDPENLIGVEVISSETGELTEREIEEVTRHWPEDWVEKRRDG